MLLMPRKTKFSKFRKGGSLKFKNVPHKAKLKGHHAALSLKYGDYGLISKKNWRLTAEQIEATRRAIVNSLKRSGRLWLRAFPDIPVSSKPIDARMGKGKGTTSYWASRVKEGQVLIEITGVSEESARTALLKGARKLPFSVKFVSRIKPKKS